MDIDVPKNVDIKYNINRDDKDDIWLNVYHLKVPEENRNEGLGSEAVEGIKDFFIDSEARRVVVTMQVPEDEIEKAKHIFLEKFKFDSLEGPYEHRRYDNYIIEAELEDKN